MMPSGGGYGYGQQSSYSQPTPQRQPTYPPQPFNPGTPSSAAPSYSDHGYHDYTADYHGGNDDFETKSYNSHTHLNSHDGSGPSTPHKEYGIGAVVPSVSYTPPPVIGREQYPPSPTLMGYPPPGGQQAQLPAMGFSGSSGWHSVRNQLLARRVVKQIPLFNGNLVMDVPVPKGVVPTSTGAVGAEPGEMEKLRYTAATCDPDDFTRRKFHLRQYLYGRKTELFVSVVERGRGGCKQLLVLPGSHSADARSS